MFAHLVMVMVAFIQVCVTAVCMLTGCWQEAPIGYLAPFSVTATTVNSWETFT